MKSRRLSKGGNVSITGQNAPAYPAWAFRMWHGMTLKAWLGLLARNRFAVSPRRGLTLLDITVYATLNSSFALLQHLIYGGRIARTEISVPPVFIVGHWRTGTTWLHEMLALDERFVAPSTYECLAAAHALVTEPISGLSRFRVPAQRPMDDMPLGWERPQEDELAMMALGAGSFFETFAFPDRRPVRAEYIDLKSVTETQRRRWIAARLYFMKQVLWRARREARRNGRDPSLRLLLKSPADTARLGLLSSLFPGARFIHVVRNPDDIFASTVRLWTRLASTQSLQAHDWRARPDGTPSLEEFVLMTFERLYRNFAAERAALPEGQVLDVRYEDMVRDPLAVIERVYDHCGWDGFAALRPRIAAYVREAAGRGRGGHDLSLTIKDQIAERWADYRTRYGYGAS